MARRNNNDFFTFPPYDHELKVGVKIAVIDFLRYAFGHPVLEKLVPRCVA